MGPPISASGPMCPIQAPVDTPEKRASVSTATCLPNDRCLSVVNEGVSIGDIVQGLNALGVTPRDLISILQAIRAAGALMAELVIM